MWRWPKVNKEMGKCHWSGFIWNVVNIPVDTKHPWVSQIKNLKKDETSITLIIGFCVQWGLRVSNMNFDKILEVGVLLSSCHVFWYFRENWKCSYIFTTKASLSCAIWIVASNIKSQPYLLNLIPENQYSLGNIGTVANYSIRNICV